MMKKITSLCIAFILITLTFGAIPAHALTYGDLTYKVTNGEVTIKGCEQSATEVTIPNKINGYPVTTIGEGAFWGCTGLTSITIPDGVTTIGITAFRDCTGLTSITIPDGVTTIGEGAFWGCTGLTSITIPDGVTTIGDYAFENCTGLTSITISDGVTAIGSYAFEDCTGLSKVNITDVAAWCNIGFSNYYSNPLYYAKNLYLNNQLVTNLVIPNGVTTIGNSAFSYCESLTSITIPDSITTIGNYAFSCCTGLTSITIPDGVTAIGNYAFSNCYSLTSITIPAGVTTIGKYAFFYCESLTSVTIPDGVTTIGGCAFEYCTGLTSITIPDGVTTIGGYAFYYCRDLISVSIGSGIHKIPEKAFYNCYSLKYVGLSAGVSSIQNDAFSGCSNIETVFYEGTEAEWQNILFYNRNENLTNAKIVYNASERTYRFETNCETSLPDVTDYAVFTAPTVQNEDKTFLGWYDNQALSGEPVTFPYYGTATTLYAAWTDKTGKSFDDAFTAKANQTYTVTTGESGQLVYFAFTPTKSKTYYIYSQGSKNTYGYLYNSKQSQLTKDDDSGDGNNFRISYNFTAGQTYYIAAKVYSGYGTFDVTFEEPIDYRINSITLSDNAGNELTAIPENSFLATVSFTNVTSNENAVIVLAQYTKTGAFKNVIFVKTKDLPQGATMEYSLPIDNKSGDIAYLKAFCWESFTSMMPVGDAVTYPNNEQ